MRVRGKSQIVRHLASGAMRAGPKRSEIPDGWELVCYVNSPLNYWLAKQVDRMNVSAGIDPALVLSNLVDRSPVRA